MAKERDYKKEYKDYHSKPEQKKNRAARNKARREMGLKVGDPREVDHKKPLSKGGSNAKSNLRVVSRTTNRKKGNKLTNLFHYDTILVSAGGESMVQTTIRLPEELHKRLKKEAKRRGISLNAYIIGCLFGKGE